MVLLKYLGVQLIAILVKELVKFIKEYVERKRLEGEIKKKTSLKIKEIRKEKDAKTRADKLRTLLND